VSEICDVTDFECCCCCWCCCCCCCCRETLRRDPVVGVVIRVATRDFQLGEYGVPAGTNLMLPLRTLAEQDPRWVDSTGGGGRHVFAECCQGRVCRMLG
jgi:hypothetical protein